MWRKLKRIITYLLVLALAIVLGISISLYLFKDRIVQQIVRTANTKIDTPIRVEHINLNLIDKFPQIAISFHGVLVEESWPDSSDPLLIAEALHLTLNPFKLLTGVYEINQIHIEQAELFLRINGQGENNYRILKASDSDTNDSLLVDLKKITLQNVTIHYQDDENLQEHKYFISSQQATVSLRSGLYFINSKGDIRTEYIRIKGKDYAKGKDLRLVAKLQYNPEIKEVIIEPSELFLRNSKFAVNGKILTGTDSHVDLSIKGVETNIQTLFNLLPSEFSENLNKYKSSGGVYFDMTINGYTKEKIGVDLYFGLDNAELTHPDFDIRISNVYLDGHYTTSSFLDLSRSSLNLKGVKGTLADRQFEAEVSLTNLDDPIADITIQGLFDVEELIKLIPKGNGIVSGIGLIECQVSLQGRLSDLKSKYTSQMVETSGDINFQNVTLNFQDGFPPQTTLDGNFVFNKNDLAINNTRIKSGSSEWQMNGFFRNILPYLLFQNQPIGIEADINADFININELLPGSQSNLTEDFAFTISPYLLLDFNCDVKKLVYRKFEARKLKGELRVKNQKAIARNIAFNSMGGRLIFSGIVDASKDYIQVSSSSQWKRLSIDSVFYVFNNFNQDWLVAENLKGRVNANVATELAFHPDLSLYSDSLVLDISISIVDGELNNFEPMMQLEDYVDDPNLSRLKFSELENDIHVENRMIYIPRMEVRTNVTNIQVSGSHTFDQEIDYRVVVPLKTLGKNRKEDMFGAVEDDGSGSKLHLKITGTTENYEIQYDAEGVKKKILADFKKEVNELKNAFRKKEKIIREAELNEEEFFEWEEDTLRYHPYHLPRLLPHLENY